VVDDEEEIAVDEVENVDHVDHVEMVTSDVEYVWITRFVNPRQRRVNLSSSS
jgi:transcriptional regulator CtsR